MEIVLDIKNLIYTIRGIKVMLDSDLAKIYGYQTRSFNQQVKNNIEKFDEDFRFQLTKEEYEKILMSKNLTSNWGGTRKLPFVFTEQGVYMLMTVLKGELAVKQSKILIKAFKEMKDFIIGNNNFIENRELLQIAIQTSQNTSDIAHIKNTMINKDDVLKIIKDFTDIHIKKEYLILNGETVEANLAYDSIYKTAQNKIYVIDNYIGLKTLVMLKNVDPNITITIFSDNISYGLHQKEFIDFCKQYPKISITFRKTCGIFHDRYIILDYNDKNEQIYHCGASSKDAGNKIMSISKVNENHVYHQIIDTLLNNPILTLK